MTSNPAPHCYQINLQLGAGGGEIYTEFFTRALTELGWQVTLFVARRSWLAQNLRMGGLSIVGVDGLEDIPPLMPPDGATVFAHAPFSGTVADVIRQNHPLIFFAHMPLYGRNPAPFRSCDLVLGVSRHVIDSLHQAGIDHVYHEPLYGVASLDRGPGDSGPITAASVYDWDKRKVRDRLLSYVHPVYLALKPQRVFAKKPGLTLGIVSRLTPIKQFPLLFSLLAPVIKEFPSVNLEIFGSGGYASVRDLRRALKPVSAQVRFWGHQRDVSRIYQQLDYLMTGLPEKEALGLNVIEAQACGTPVLAVDAPPFTETVVHGKTGFLYADPRGDRATDFRALLKHILSASRPNPMGHLAHLGLFGYQAYRERLARLLDKIGNTGQQAL